MRSSQAFPSVIRVQDPDSVTVLLSQIPFSQVGVLHDRVRVPLVLQPSPRQEDHAVQLGVPQPSPSVSRTQSRVSMRVRAGAQAPPEHDTRSLHVRIWVPDSPHVPENPLHGLQPPHDAAEHSIPSVTREHATVWVEGWVAHDPAAHTPSLQVRERMPSVAHAPEKPAHSPYSPHEMEAQRWPSVSRTQLCES